MTINDRLLEEPPINRHKGLLVLLYLTPPSPVLAWQEPFSPYFDSSRIWGPVVGRQVYAGIRIN